MPDQEGKYYTVGIEGNNCRLRHRIKRAVRTYPILISFFFGNWKNNLLNSPPHIPATLVEKPLKEIEPLL